MCRAGKRQWWSLWAARIDASPSTLSPSASSCSRPKCPCGSERSTRTQRPPGRRTSNVRGLVKIELVATDRRFDLLENKRACFKCYLNNFFIAFIKFFCLLQILQVNFDQLPMVECHGFRCTVEDINHWILSYYVAFIQLSVNFLAVQSWR